MSWREKRINDVLKSHDRLLFVNTNAFGVRQVLRKNYTYREYSVDGETLLAIEPAHQFIMALTEDWTPKTQNVDWGLEPILRRLKEIDGWNSQSEVNRLEEKQKKIDESKDRDLTNKMESFAYDWRDSFKKGFSDINTINMNKIDKRKLKGA